MYPVSYEADFRSEPNRATTFFRVILAIPWIIVAYVYAVVALFTHIFAWVAIVITGRYPEGLYKLNSGFVRYFVRTYAWIYLQSDEWPPFGIADDPSYPIRVDVAPRAEHQSRLTVFFRLILVIPMLIVAYGVNYLHLGAAVVAWLTIVFRGYLPAGINSALTFCNSFYARVYGYMAFLTDDYPPVGEERAHGVGNPATSPGPVAPQAPPAAPTA